MLPHTHLRGARGKGVEHERPEEQQTTSHRHGRAGAFCSSRSPRLQDSGGWRVAEAPMIHGRADGQAAFCALSGALCLLPFILPFPSDQARPADTHTAGHLLVHRLEACVLLVQTFNFWQNG